MTIAYRQSEQSGSSESVGDRRAGGHDGAVLSHVCGSSGAPVSKEYSGQAESGSVVQNGLQTTFRMHTRRGHEHQFGVGRALAVSGGRWFERESGTAEEFALQRIQCGVQVVDDPQAFQVSLAGEVFPE
ncbi:hypothetical protein ACFFS2_30605 [Streptomyces aurantiacus]|uniref:hypothetical protein n=1 Tax=Streptomyces aurantiacus TaxID=47760 RepID=UPI0006E40EEE|nr:hypothetical protein [Streptomyces aurantiacus]